MGQIENFSMQPFPVKLNVTKHGGWIIVGVVDKTYELKGVPYEKVGETIRDITNVSRKNIKPPLRSTIRIVSINYQGKEIIGVAIKKANQGRLTEVLCTDKLGE